MGNNNKTFSGLCSRNNGLTPGKMPIGETQTTQANIPETKPSPHASDDEKPQKFK